MAVLMQEPHTELTPQDDAVVIPDFREDERIFARYDAMLQRRIKQFKLEHEGSIRRNASAKRDELREELEKAQAEQERCATVADEARAAYRAAFPHHVKRTRLVEPTMLENVRSLGAAKRLYTAAHDAWLAAEKAMSALRKVEHNEGQLEIELQRALERAPQVSTEVTESEKWLAEIHAEEELAAVKAKVDAIVAERDAYAERLAAGRVSAAEKRLRAFGQAGIKHIALPVSGLLFVRVETYDAAYLIGRDTRKQLVALPYDPRLEPMLDGVYDIAKTKDGFVAKRSLRDNGPLQMTVRDHCVKCTDSPEAANEAYLAHREFLKQSRPFPAAPCDEVEASAIAALLELIPVA